jgi:hypothetical protein
MKSQADDATAQADCDSFGPVALSKLFHNVLLVPLHRLLADREERGDVAVAVADRDFLEVLNFATAERVTSEVFS